MWGEGGRQTELPASGACSRHGTGMMRCHTLYMHLQGVKAPPNNEPGAPYSYEEFTPHPDLGQYEQEGNLVAELHYKGFQVVGGEEDEEEDSDNEEDSDDSEGEDSEGEEKGFDLADAEIVVHEQVSLL